MLLQIVVSAALAANVSVDVRQNRRAISPLIYGVNFAPDAQARRMGVTLQRFGGNQYSRFNYLNLVTNEGGDNRYFRNVLLDAGVEQLLARSRDAGIDVMVELPLLGWVSKAGASNTPPRTCSFSVAKYGAALGVAPDDADCGNGRYADGGPVLGNDPLDTSEPIDAGWLGTYVDRLFTGGTRYFELGNQPSLWNSTHADVHPQPASYLEIRAKLIEATAVAKAQGSQAKTLGPSEWGWINYFDSAAEDRADSGVDFVPYYLNEARLLEQQRGSRQLDYLDLHIYPQAAAPDTAIVTSNDTQPATVALRLRSTRILWDPAYTVESWETCCYDTEQRIIPRMREWIATSYPGTGISVSGYDWGAPDHISGALALVDVLGIFGREGVDLAMLETLPSDGAIGEDAFKLYRNFDGSGGHFGNVSVRASSDDPARVASFASVEGPKVYVVLINKDFSAAQNADIFLAGVAQDGTWRAFGFSATARLGTSSAGGTFTNGTLTRTLAAGTAEILELTVDTLDAGTPVDAGTDAGVDAGTDAGTDAGYDAGFDAGIEDAGFDGGFDAGFDAGTPDAGRDAGTFVDAGKPDAGPADAGDGGGKGGCGCNGGGAPLLLALIAALRSKRRCRALSSRPARRP